MTTGVIFDIQRFCTHDGPGIRTVVFLKGCPLNCAWCHNPESKIMAKQLFYTPTQCIGCGGCALVCPQHAHSMVDGGHIFDRTKCTACLKCVEVCNARALEAAGKDYTVEQALAEVEKDRVFYDESGGGMTISGGEPMLQFEFTSELLRQAKAVGISTAIETSGCGQAERFLDLIPHVDLFLWDVKDTDEQRHQEFTGRPIGPIIENLKSVDAAGGGVLMRCLIVEGVNTTREHLDGIARIYSELHNTEGVELLEYHALGESKRSRLGLPIGDRILSAPSAEFMTDARRYLSERWGIKIVNA